MMKLLMERSDLDFNVHFRYIRKLNPDDEIETAIYYNFPLLEAIENNDAEAFNLLISDPRFVFTKKDLECLCQVDEARKEKLYSHPNYNENLEIDYKSLEIHGNIIEIGSI